MQEKSVILSYASKGREDYFAAQLKQLKSIRDAGWQGDVLAYADGGYCDEYAGYKIELGFPKTDEKIFHQHNVIPYQFKLAMIQKAIELGYTKIFWADSTFRLVKGKDINELLDASEYGVMAFHNLGHDLYKYITDKAVYNLGITEAQLIEIPQCFGGVWGFDFSKQSSQKIFQQLYEQSNLGSFNEGESVREGFVAHRHEQAVISVLFWLHGIKLLPYGTITYHPHQLPPYEYGQDFYGYFQK